MQDSWIVVNTRDIWKTVGLDDGLYIVIFVNSFL